MGGSGAERWPTEKRKLCFSLRLLLVKGRASFLAGWEAVGRVAGPLKKGSFLLGWLGGSGTGRWPTDKRKLSFRMGGWRWDGSLAH